METDKPRRWLFWLLLAAVSTFFAEVVSGSELAPFFTPWGLLGIVPLYGLHVVVLGGLAYSKGTPRFSTLYAAGMLFGLYEAYITKVLWEPPWLGLSLPFAGIEVLSTLTLVLWWHPFMSFIIPLMVVELLGASSSGVWASLPQRLQGGLRKRWVQVALAFCAGLLLVGSRLPFLGALDALLGLWVPGVLLGWWRLTSGQRYKLSELLPRGRSWWLLLAALTIYYLFSAFSLRPLALPGLGGQAAIWAIYALSGWLLWRNLKRPAAQQETPAVNASMAWVALLAGVYLISSLVASFLPEDIRNLLFLIETVFGWVFGVSVLIYCLKETIRQ